MTYILSTDVVSFTRSIYGRRGDQVEVISVHGSVAIVEGASGRFPCPITLLEGFHPDPTKPETPPSPMSTQDSPGSKKRKSGIQGHEQQTTLF